MTSFSDLLSADLWDGITTVDFDIDGMLTTMLVSLICAMIIFVFYRFFFRGIIYNKNFNILMVMVCLTTSFIIMAISSNIVLSLGMVGALSIVRFRAAIKDPLDIGFLFWAISAGITSGAQLYALSIFCVIFIGIVYILLTAIKSKHRNYLLIVKYHDDETMKVQEIIEKLRYTVKNRTCRNHMTELTLEVKSSSKKTNYVRSLSNLELVESAVLVEYNGAYSE